MNYDNIAMRINGNTSKFMNYLLNVSFNHLLTVLMLTEVLTINIS